MEGSKSRRNPPYSVFLYDNDTADILNRVHELSVKNRATVRMLVDSLLECQEQERNLAFPLIAYSPDRDNIAHVEAIYPDGVCRFRMALDQYLELEQRDDFEQIIDGIVKDLKAKR